MTNNPSRCFYCPTLSFRAARCGSCAALSARRYFLALINPALHADDPVSGVGLRESEIDVGAQRLQRQTALQVPLFARDFRAVQSAADVHLYTLATETQRGINRLPHGPAEGHALFELQGNRLRHQLRGQLRTMHFLNVDVHFPLGALLYFALELVDLRTLASYDDARPRSVDADHQLVGCALDIDRIDARRLEPVFQLAPQDHVLVQQVGILALGEPA